ncbi:tRNA uridine-5-carboxymethylaminomethyl(34) synthesis GTPase MnmE [uncultured Ruminobacter sp.]|uniref:tRNA uridine-5-carboxymethylaminomethyl(34) synthesis GTPase MnmE n=1 Tax=uncultured Ruminobacter sp. TaxID=538947 RepID=UPI0025D53955|nr:tRNA uridine-5-carboxymethylaminomethyl(34) synthesis GTPase MnmE [uncultured Ruminobacter sp.]
MDKETIAAIATSSGKGGIGVIRVAGPKSTEICKIITGSLPPDHMAVLQKFKSSNGDVLDEGITLYFKAPHSFTGDDIVEFQCHGGPVIMDMLLKEILNIPDVRQAGPGEFTQRAFLNGKIDLAQAEAIIDLINASSEKAALSASRSLQGVFSEKINNINDRLIKLRTYVEATIDFPDESIDFINDGQVEKEMHVLVDAITSLLNEARQGVILQEGIKIVIAGRPNAGKSSLLNALCGKDLAIVTNIEGTTRDAIHENIDIDGLPLHIVDTAGLRSHTSDLVEQIGINRAWNEIEEADRILFVFDVSRNEDTEQLKLFKDISERTGNKVPFSIICNKTDLVSDYSIPNELSNYPQIPFCSKDLTGMDNLREHLKKCAGYNNTTEGLFSARRRHLESLEEALVHLQKGIELINCMSAFELCAEELRNAQNNLNDILGRFTADDLLGKIFSTFCVGK